MRRTCMRIFTVAGTCGPRGRPPSNGCFVNLTPVDEDMRLSLWADGFELELTSESVSMMVRSFSRGDPSTIGR